MGPTAIRFFDWLRPKLTRLRRKMDAGANDAALARVTDLDPIYRAVMDHAFELLEEATQAMIQPKLTKREREFLAGRANGLLTLISNLESTRVRARELQEKIAARAGAATVKKA